MKTNLQGIVSFLILLTCGVSAWANDNHGHTATTPMAGEIMLQMGERYQNLYWAAKLGQWDFARYQAEEMQELIEKLIAVQPQRAPSARVFLENVYPLLPGAIGTREWEKFVPAFEAMRQQCTHCHRANARAYITLPIPKRAPSPVLDME